MAFKASYVYKIDDQYTRPIKQIAAQTKNFRNQIKSSNTELKNYRKEMRGAALATKKFAQESSKDMDKLASKISNVAKKSRGGGTGKGKKGEGFGTAITGLVAGAGLKAGFTAIKDEAFDLEQTVINLQKAFDFASQNELKAFTDSLIGVKQEVGLSKAEINNLAFQAGKLGLPKEEVAEFSLLVGKTAVAFEDTIENATGTLADLRTKFGMNNKELQLTLGTVNTLADNTSASAKDILEVTQRLSGQFKALEVPPEVAAGFAAAARQIGVTTELSASGMKMFIQGLQNAKKVGPGVGEALQKDFKGTIFKVIDKLKGISKEKQPAIIQEIFGKEASTFVLSLINSTDVLNKTLGISADKVRNMASLDKEFNRQKEAGIFLQQQTSAAWKDFKAILGTVVLPVIKDLIIGMTKILSVVSSFAEKNPLIVKMVLGLGAFAAVAATLAGGIAVLGLAIPAITAGLAGLGTILAIITGPIGIIVAGIGMITAGFLGLLAEGGKVTQMFKDMGAWVDNFFGTTLGSSVTGGITDFANSLFGSETPAISVEKKTQNQQNINLNGNLRIQAEPGTKVTGGSLKKNTPGNLGLNLAGAL